MIEEIGAGLAGGAQGRRRSRVGGAVDLVRGQAEMRVHETIRRLGRIGAARMECQAENGRRYSKSDWNDVPASDVAGVEVSKHRLSLAQEPHATNTKSL